MYRRLAINTAVNLLNLAFNIVINFALAPIFINELGSEAYGLWVLVSSLSVLRGFLRIFDLGIASSVVKFVAEFDARGDRAGISQVVSASLIVYSIVGVVAAIGLIFFGAYGAINIFNIPSSQEVATRTLITWLAFQTIIDFLSLSASGMLEGLQRYDITRGSNILRLIVFAVLSIMLINGGLTVYALAIATTFSESLRIVVHVYWIYRLAPWLRLTRRVSAQLIRAMFSLSSKVFIFAIANTVYEQMDKFIISAMLTTTLLTDYDISNRIHTLVFALTTMIGPFVVPMASSLQAKNDREELRQLLVRATLYIGAMTVPTALLTIILAKPLTEFWLGPDFIHTVGTSQLFISYLLFWFLLRAGQNMLIGINRLNVILPAFILGTVVNLVISIALAPSTGVIGIVAGTFIGNTVVCVPYIRAFKREFGVGIRDLIYGILLRIYPYALIAAFVIWVLTEWRQPHGLVEVMLYGCAGMTLFAILFFMFGVPNEERQALRQIRYRLRRMRYG